MGPLGRRHDFRLRRRVGQYNDLPMATTRVMLLGGGGIQAQATWIPWVAEKRLQLIAYLAYQGDWIARDRLVYLFWSDHEEHAARRNLRKTLHKLKRLPWLNDLEVEAEQVRWAVPTDVEAFRRAVGNRDWERAIEVCRGPLMATLDSGAACEFLAWLEIERERLQALWRDAVLKQAAKVEAAGRALEGQGLLQTLLEHDPLDEEAVRRLMTVAIAAGRVDQAQRIYRNFEATLAEELDLEPSLATRQLATSLAAARSTHSESAPASGQTSLEQDSAELWAPTSWAAGTFVGRDDELSELARLLVQPDCRLLTLVGAGGAGKSRLAWEAARSMASEYSGSSTFVERPGLGLE